MNPSDISAYIGAAAWLPQIAQWVYNATAKPKLKIVPALNASIGYSLFGPIINLTAAVHSKRDTRLYTWAWMNETQYQVDYSSGETSEVYKRQMAIALRVGID